MTPRVLLACVVTLAVAAFPAVAQNLVTNGSFEDPVYPEGFNHPVPVTAWSISPDTGFEVWHISTPGYAAAGVQLLELEMVQCDTITQTVPAVANWPHELRFAYSARPGVTGTQQMEVRWNGQLLATVSAAAIAAFQNPIWTYYTFRVYGAPGTNTLAFTALGPCDGAGSLLDDVSLVELQNVPALDTIGLALLAAVLAAVAWGALRRA